MPIVISELATSTPATGYVYQPGSKLEVPGVEAVLEYGDASTYAHADLPGSLRINDRSMPDQVHVAELTGLHDDPDVGDSRTERAGHWGERAGLLMPRGRTVGITGYVKAGSVTRMRDMWRRMRAQFGRAEQDLVIHPPGETAFYANELWSTSVLGWSYYPTDATVTAGTPNVFSDLRLNWIQESWTTTAGATATSLYLSPTTPIPWHGEDVWMSAILRPTSTVAISSIALSALFVIYDGTTTTPVLTWTATGAGVVASPTSGSLYQLSARATAQAAGQATHVIPRLVMVHPGGAASITLRAARAAAVLLKPAESSPTAFFDGTLPGFEWDSLPDASRSYGPCHVVNQVSDTTSSTATSWANDSTAGAVVDSPGTPVYGWPSDDRTANAWTIRNPDTTSRSLAVRTPATLTDPGLFVVVGGRTYRAHARVRISQSFVGCALQVVWVDKDGATISTSTVGTFDPVASGAATLDEAIDGAIVAPALAMRAYMRIASTANATSSGQQIALRIADPRFFDVTEYDAGNVDVSGAQQPEHGMAIYAPSRSGPGLLLTPRGAIRRIPRPFLLRKVRALWDGKAPESQRNLQYRRDFTMSLRASDPRIYVLDERHATLKMSGAQTLEALQMSAFGALLDSPGAVVANDSFIGAVTNNPLNGRTAPLGGTWVTSGDATDFSFFNSFVGINETGDGIKSVHRTTLGVETVGRWAVLGTTAYTDVQIECRVYDSGGPTVNHEQSIARWLNASNYVVFVLPGAVGTPETIRVDKMVGGVVTTLASGSFTRVANTTYKLRLSLFSNGKMIAQILNSAGIILVQLSATSVDLATGGAIPFGKPAICDQNKSATDPSSDRRYTDFSVAVPLDPFSAPTNFTFETIAGQSASIEVRWRSSSLGSPFPRGGVTLGWDERNPPASGYLSQANVARMYYSSGAITYTTPQVTVGGDCISGSGVDYNLFSNALIGNVWQYNYIGAILKRVNSTTWIEARYTSANQVAMNAAHPAGGSVPVAPNTLELWCSHTAAGAAGVTRLAGWDVSTSNITDGLLKHLRTYMDSTGVIYVELWNDDPNLNDSGLVARHSFTLAGGLSAVIGPTVAGRPGMITRLGQWDDGTNSGISVSRMQTNYDTPYLAYFEAVDFSTSLLLLSCSVIGDADDVPLQVVLRGDLDTPRILLTNHDTGKSSSLSLSGVFSDADPVTIDMDAGTIVSSAGVDYFNRRVSGSRFFSLEPGQNTLVIQAVGWNANAPAHVIATWLDALK